MFGGSGSVKCTVVTMIVSCYRSFYVQLLNEVLVTPHSGDNPTEVVDHVSIM